MPHKFGIEKFGGAVLDGLLFYHRRSDEIVRPFWSVRPELTNVIQRLRKIREDGIKALRTWKKIPEQKRTESAKAQRLHGFALNIREEQKLFRCYPCLRALANPEGPGLHNFVSGMPNFRTENEAKLFNQFLYEISESRNWALQRGRKEGKKNERTPKMMQAARKFYRDVSSLGSGYYYPSHASRCNAVAERLKRAGYSILGKTLQAKLRSLYKKPLKKPR